MKYKKEFWIGKVYQDRGKRGEFHLLVRDVSKRGSRQRSDYWLVM